MLQDVNISNSYIHFVNVRDYIIFSFYFRYPERKKLATLFLNFLKITIKQFSYLLLIKNFNGMNRKLLRISNLKIFSQKLEYKISWKEKLQKFNECANYSACFFLLISSRIILFCVASNFLFISVFASVV